MGLDKNKPTQSNKVIIMTEISEKELIENLLKPRVKLIAPVPFIEDEVSTILVSNQQGIFLHPTHDEGSAYCIIWEDLEQYPHLFKRLEWYEERQESEMPQYIRIKNTHTISFVEEWDLKSDMGWICRVARHWHHKDALLPATEQEYINQNKQQ